MKKNGILLLAILGFVYLGTSQSPQKIDSLLRVIETTSNDSIKLRLTNQVSFYFIFNDIERAKTLLNKGLKDAKNNNFDFGYNELTNTKGIYFDVTGQKDSARFYFKKGLDLSRKNNFKNIEQMSLNNLGMFNWNNGSFEQALNYFYQALEMNRSNSSKNIQGEAIYLNNIGLIYQELKQYEKAIEHHKKALKIREDLNLDSEQATSLSNLGVCYKSLYQYDKSIKAYERAIALSEKSKNTRNYYAFFDNLASVYYEMENYEKAIEFYKKALERPEIIGENPKSDLSTYGNLTAAFVALNQPIEALFYATKGFQVLEKNPQLKNFAGTLYKSASESHFMLNNINKGSKLLAEFIAINDSIFSSNNAKAIAGLEVKFKTQEKEIQLAETRAALAENELKIGRKNLLIYGTLALTLFIAILGFLIYTQQKLKNQQLRKEAELKDALNQIAIQNELQEQRLRISRDLHDNIGAQLTFIISTMDAIKYGFKLQDEKLGDRLRDISQFTSNTIFELRDTIWAMNKTQISFEDLNSRITNFINKTREVSEFINFNFEVSEEVNQKQHFTSVEGMNIYRIIQEALHNSLKYACAKNIHIHISETPNEIEIKIQDDGVGFDLEKVELGNGIYNMQKRAKEIMAKLNIESRKNKGTKILLFLKKEELSQQKEAS
jgi:signal transduction histidine kinase/Flp pilus assembly protein TadD